jgi:hypothetical protein
MLKTSESIREKSNTATLFYQGYKGCQALVAPVRYRTELVLVDEGIVEDAVALALQNANFL